MRDRFIDQGPDLVFGVVRERLRDFCTKVVEFLVRFPQSLERLDVDEGRYRLARLGDDDSSAPIPDLVQQVAKVLSHRHGRGFSDHGAFASIDMNV